ncbi:MAG: type IV secretory system conjugative DNA transfer family protein [Burkholderiaceae bacterium]|jgi:type IV secretion system protein VirD4|nr:type IV secretory system conjugative DNA transfer family protein [Burkholderiaceae bacterium]
MTAGPASIYQIPKTERDPARFIWWGIFVWVFITVCACWLTSQYMAWALNLKPMAMPWDCFFWFWSYNKEEYGERVLAVLGRAHVLLGVGALASMFIPVALMWKEKSRVHGQRNDLYGSAHWATPAEVAATGLLPDDKNKGGVLFGAYTDGSRVQYLRHKGPEHMLVFAPTRSGKGVGIVIPTLLSWDHSVLVNDLKGENWELSSGFREKVLGQRCIRFAPANEGSARFNPLDAIRMDKNLVKDVQNIATMIVDPDGKGLEDHWAKTGFDLLVGTILYILLEDSIQQKNLAGVAALLSDGGEIRQLAAEDAKKGRKPEDDEIDGAQAVMLYIAKVANQKLDKNEFASTQRGQAERIGWNVAAQAAGAMNNKAPNEFSSVMSTSLSFLTLYRDPIVAGNTATSDFSIEELMGFGFQDGQPKGPKVSLYIVSPSSDMDRIKPLTRLVLNMTLRRLTEGMDYNPDGTSKSLYPHRLLLLIDEFPSLGKLDVFEEALAFIAGYGLKALLITQDLSQLQKAYTKDESIVSNCHIRIAYAPNKIETAELLSHMTGKATVTQTQLQYSGSRLAVMLQNVNTSENTVGRELLTPDECMRLPPDDELVFMAGYSPIYCQKIKYYADSQLRARMLMRAASSQGRREAQA